MFRSLFYPMQACFLCTKSEDKQNVTFAEWVMPASTKPPMIAVALHKKSYSLELLSKSKQFAVCVLPESMKEVAFKVKGCSGRMIDKFSEFSIKTMPAKQIEVPIIADSIGSVECRVDQITCLGDFYLVVGEVVNAQVNQDGKGKEPVLLKWGDKSYIGMSEAIAKEAKKDEGLITRVQKAVFGKKAEGQANGKK